MKHWFSDAREPKDLDFISKQPKTKKEEEHHWVEGYQYIVNNNKDSKFVDPDFLYTIKVSHAAWDVQWDKTMFDIEFLKSKECSLDTKLYKLLYKDWEVVHNKKKINLKMKNQEFFGPHVSREYDHDWLHEQLAYYDEPMHNKIRPDKDSSWCSKKLWDNLSEEDKLICALEETWVIAMERFIFKGMPPRFSKIKALKLLITSATKGWFNLYLIEHFDELRKTDNDLWLNKINLIRN